MRLRSQLQAHTCWGGRWQLAVRLWVFGVDFHPSFKAVLVEL